MRRGPEVLRGAGLWSILRAAPESAPGTRPPAGTHQ
ncbi:hypothetical protein E2C01_070652 [Portunus trituberculatus]|uniref:Uncharacterized protein n=1 Tax=Portunus trituberculatus TaxID=210409 RepID=A0A5B7I274_PORTR|nr:hypothetical protein [Portunus trituberculatus]